MLGENIGTIAGRRLGEERPGVSKLSVHLARREPEQEADYHFCFFFLFLLNELVKLEPTAILSLCGLLESNIGPQRSQLIPHLWRLPTPLVSGQTSRQQHLVLEHP